jgi:hypothetical protein
MGSGAFANAGWQKAAYQRRIYFPTAGGSAQLDRIAILAELLRHSSTPTRRRGTHRSVGGGRQLLKGG